MSRRAKLLILSTGLLLAAALATVPGVSAGGGCHQDQQGAVHGDGATTVVKMDGCAFVPTVARVEAGTVVRFLNTSMTTHVVTGERGEWGSAQIEPGEAFSQAFGEAGGPSLFLSAASGHGRGDHRRRRSRVRSGTRGRARRCRPDRQRGATE